MYIRNNNEPNLIQNEQFQCYMPKLAHAYVPFQCMMNIYPPMIGLDRGTIFPELDSPYGADPEFTLDQ